MIISPSLLAADFMNLARDIDMINRSEADMLHIDIMDGVFVPNISFGFSVLEPVAQACTKPLDVHLMTFRPEQYLDRLARLGVASMNVHVEACTHLQRCLAEIHKAGMRTAVTLNPSTPLCSIEEVLTDTDMVLLMSVNPGYGGQRFIPNTLSKVARLREMIARVGTQTVIEVDGGVNATTAPQLAEAGADVLVSGSYIFNASDPSAVIHELKQL